MHNHSTHTQKKIIQQARGRPVQKYQIFQMTHDIIFQFETTEISRIETKTHVFIRGSVI